MKIGQHLSNIMMMESPVGMTYMSSGLTKRGVAGGVIWSTGDLHWWLDYSGRSLCTVWSHSLVLTHHWPLVQMTATSGLVEEDAAGGQCRGWTSCAFATTSSAVPLSAPGAVVSIVRGLRPPEPLRSSPVTPGRGPRYTPRRWVPDRI